MIAINELEKLAKSKHDESVRFRTYLKTHANEEELDKDFKKLHDKYFKIYDCSKCRNCCKELGVSIGYDEIDKLHLSKEQLSNLKDKYMQIKNNKTELTPVKSRLIPGYKIKIEPITNPIIEKNVGI